MELLDDIENFKQVNQEDEIKDIINDKSSSILYIVGFGDKIFNNSLKQIKQHVSNKSTALSFLASVNFYELIKLWPDQDVYEMNELMKKIRYAKFHAARILKSLRKGEDPNEYDPPEFELKDEPEVPFKPEEESTPAGLPNMEDDDDDDDNLGLPKVPQFIDDEPNKKQDQDQEPELSKEKSPSPSFKLPEPPKSKPGAAIDVDPEPITPRESTPKVNEPSSSSSRSLSQPIIKDNSTKPVTKFDVSQIIESGEIYNKAQKHAKFAISAMNYEDKETALKQLKEAIALLDQLEI